MEEKERMFENMKQLLTSIYNLSFSNPLITIMEQLKGRSTLQAEEAYGEIFDNPSVRPYFHLFLGTDEAGKMKLSNFGRALESFIEYAHAFLDDDDTIARINKTFDLKLSNPLRDLAYSCIEQLNERERKIVRLAANSTYERFDTVQNQMKNRFNLEVSIDEIKRVNEKMRAFLLNSEDDRFSIPTRLQKHVLEATKYLEEA